MAYFSIFKIDTLFRLIFLLVWSQNLMHVYISFKPRKYHFFSFMLWFLKNIDQILVLQYYTTKVREGISFLFFLGILFFFHILTTI